MQKDEEKFVHNNNSPFNIIKVLSAGDDGRVNEHMIEVSDTQKTTSESQLLAKCSSKSVIIAQQQYKYERIFSIALSFNTRTLFTANDSGVIKHYQQDEVSLQYSCVITLKGSYGWIPCLSLSNSNMFLLSAGQDGTLRVWDAANGAQLACLNQNNEYQFSQFYSCCWNGDDSLLASGGNSPFFKVIIWASPKSRFNESNDFMALFILQDELDHSLTTCLKFKADSYQLVISTRANISLKGRIALLDITQEILDIKKFNCENEKKHHLMTILYQPKIQKELVNFIQNFDVYKNRIVFSIYNKLLTVSADTLEKMEVKDFPQVFINSIMSVMIDRNERYIVSGGSRQQIALFDVITGNCIWNKKDHSSLYQVNSVIIKQ